MGLLNISKWELRRAGISFNKKIIIISTALIILIATISFFASQHGLHLNDNLYKVAMTDPNLGAILKIDGRFEIQIAQENRARELFEDEDFDILIIDNQISHHNTEKSISALDALNKAILRYDEARLLSYNDLNNTFPVWIMVQNIAREQVSGSLSIDKLPETGIEVPTGSAPPPSEKTVERTAKGEIPAPSAKEITDLKNNPIKDQNLATPSHFNPPVPFKSVVLSFIFIFPMYFLAQFYSASIMEERVKRKGELLLVSPVRPFEIVIGKLIPYLSITLVSMYAITVYIGGNVWMLFILLPVSLIFLSTAFMAAMIARSFKELTFILVFLSVILSGYIFLPAMFAHIHAISTISPMTLMVRMLENEPVPATEYMFSTIPFYLISFLIFMFGIFIYREEDLFTQKSMASKIMDCLQVFMESVPAPLFLLSMALLPLVFSVQMILIVLMFNLPVRAGIIIFILLAAFIEEIIKSAGIYTAIKRGLIEPTRMGALKAGILSGAGFFVAEKILLLAVIAGISSSVFGAVLGIGLLVFPLMLHVTSTTVASYLMKRTHRFLVPVIIAAIIHAAYNIYLIRGVLSG